MNKVIELLIVIVAELQYLSTAILKTQQTGIPKDSEVIEEYLSTKRVIDMIGRNEKTLYNWVQRGLLKPCSRAGTTNFYKKSDVLNAIDKDRNLDK